jgi:ATP phosphoribosyltransferase
VIKFALPTGDLRAPTAELLADTGLRVEGYGEGSRQYRLAMPSHEDVRVRVFRERDIPMQVALGNYDVGVTSLTWILELQARFPQQPLVALWALPIGGGELTAAVASGAPHTLAEIGKNTPVRIASEYPNLAEAFARAVRLPRYRVQGVAGAAAAYPPEDADLVMVSITEPEELAALGLTAVSDAACLVQNSAWLIANANSLASKDVSSVLDPLMDARRPASGSLNLPEPVSVAPSANGHRARGTVRLAIPDGHQQRHVFGALKKAGLEFEGYGEKEYVRRPPSGIEGLEIKVIRPQDMPQLVALGEFDLAITGRDILLEHLYQFPSSPAYEAVDLHVSEYNISAVVDGELPADDLAGAVAYWRSQGKRLLTVASEFAATADHYARSRHFWRYQVIPIAGASEGFVPEDADLLIEGTETGRTIAENNLKIIDHINRSTTAVIARRDSEPQGRLRDVYREFVERLRKSVA